VTEFAVGAVLVDRYRLESLLGRGGMGSVWRATHLTLNSPVAIKLIDPRIASTELGVERFVREARAAAALRSPHVVQTIDYGVHEGIPYIAMELMEGETLSNRLDRLGRLTPADTARFLTHVGRAIGKAHDAGIVHRDLKPDNIFLVHNDDEEIAKVLDFGIAKLTDAASSQQVSQTQTGTVVGTPYYMSPEQAGGAKSIDSRTDIWSMGVIAYQCLLGDLPFKGDSLGELILRICTGRLPVPSEAGPVPPGFDAWFARACARDPQQRFQTARQMTDAFRLLLTRSEALVPDSFMDSAEASAGANFPQTHSGVTKGSSTSRSRSGVQPPSGSRTTFVIVGLVLAASGGIAAYVLTRGNGGAPAGSAASPSAVTPPPPVQTAATSGTAAAEPAHSGEPSVRPVGSGQGNAHAPDAGRPLVMPAKPGRPHGAVVRPPTTAKPHPTGGGQQPGPTDFGI
jgi:serine/threonine protein kinase